ncbi:unnamed protein product [Prorocentrum cordatum]|uniref:Uncharacterized protein n=1 Tax=Prorocentrum cordatum TaxID=2364126 RepID=A0ABN9UDG8_9DINO|nr:unnamed protein product [Polarella glacialis]
MLLMGGRVAALLRELHFETAALATASGGSLQWAFDCRAAKAASSGGDGGTENTVGLSSTGYKETLTIVDDKTSQKTADPPLALAPPAATAALPAPPLAEAAPAAAPAPQLTAALAPPEEGDEQSEDALANPPEEEEDDGDPNEKTLEILEQQAAFLECFMEELKGDRPLLLSQLNNLYKMRSGEETTSAPPGGQL